MDQPFVQRACWPLTKKISFHLVHHKLPVHELCVAYTSKYTGNVTLLVALFRHLVILTLYRPPQKRWSDSIECSIEISLSGPKTTH